MASDVLAREPNAVSGISSDVQKALEVMVHDAVGASKDTEVSAKVRVDLRETGAVSMDPITPIKGF